MSGRVPFGIAEGVPLLQSASTSGVDRFLPMRGTAVGTSGTASLSAVLELPINEGATNTLVPSSNDLQNQTKNNAVQFNSMMVSSVAYGFDPEEVANEFERLTSGPLSDTATYGTGATERFGIDSRAFLYAQDEDTATQGIPLQATAAGALRTAAEARAATVTTQADSTSVGTTATSLVAINTARRSVIVQNLDATNNARVGDTNITTTRGVRLAPGESVTLETTAQIFGLAEASTVDFAVTQIAD